MSAEFEPGVSVVLIAHNEAARLPAWFERVSWADEIVVIDSGSIDRTVEVARTVTDRVFSVPNKLNFDINKNLGFSKARHQWVLSLDADELLTDELIQEIQAVTRDPDCPYAGFTLLFRVYVLGRDANVKNRQLRLFRNGLARFPGKSVHEALQLDGEIGQLQGEVLHYTDNSLFERVEKSNLYSECMAAAWFEEGQPFRMGPMLWQPPVHFLKLYRRTYRHGVLGFIMAVNGAYSVFLRHAKLWGAHQAGTYISPSDDFPPGLAAPDGK